VGVAAHDTGHPQCAVTAVGAQLEETAGLGALDRPVQDPPLLVPHVHHEAVLVAEVIDHADHIVEVSPPSVRHYVSSECLLAPVTRLPLRQETPPAQEHAQHGPSQERHRFAAEFVSSDRRSE
jgi:hypothetical protein